MFIVVNYFMFKLFKQVSWKCFWKKFHNMWVRFMFLTSVDISVDMLTSSFQENVLLNHSLESLPCLTYLFKVWIYFQVWKSIWIQLCFEFYTTLRHSQSVCLMLLQKSCLYFIFDRVFKLYLLFDIVYRLHDAIL